MGDTRSPCPTSSLRDARARRCRRRRNAFERLPAWRAGAAALLDGLGLARLIPDRPTGHCGPATSRSPRLRRATTSVSAAARRRHRECASVHIRAFGAEDDENAQCATDNVAAGPSAVTRHKCVSRWMVLDGQLRRWIPTRCRGRSSSPSCATASRSASRSPTILVRAGVKLLGFDDIATYERRSLVRTCRALLPSSRRSTPRRYRGCAVRGAVLPRRRRRRRRRRRSAPPLGTDRAAGAPRGGLSARRRPLAHQLG